MKVHAIQTGTVAVKSRQREGRGRGPTRLANTLIDRNWTEPLPIFAWLIEHPEGLIVVDTGETSRVADRGYFPWWQPYFKLGVREWVAAEDTCWRRSSTRLPRHTEYCSIFRRSFNLHKESPASDSSCGAAISSRTHCPPATPTPSWKSFTTGTIAIPNRSFLPFVVLL